MASAVTPELVKQWLDRLSEMGQQAGREEKYEFQLDIAIAEQDLGRWRDQGMAGPLPIDLAKFGLGANGSLSASAPVWAAEPSVSPVPHKTPVEPAPAPVTREIPVEPAPAPVEPPTMTTQAPAAEAAPSMGPGVLTPAAEPVIAAPQAPKPSEPQISPMPPEGKMALAGKPIPAEIEPEEIVSARQDLDRARALLEEQNLIEAIAKLEYLVAEGPELLKPEAQRWLQKAKRLRSEQIDRLLRKAQQDYVQQDWAHVRETYLAVLNLDPSHTDAKNGLERLRFEENERDRTQRLLQAKTLLRSKTSVLDLDRGALLATRLKEELRQAGQTDSELESLENQAKVVRDEINKSIGQLQTMGAAKLHEAAVRALRVQMAASVLELVGQDGTKMDLVSDLSKHLAAWRAACTQTATDRLNKARGDLAAGFPNAAKDKLERVLADAQLGGHLEELPQPDRDSLNDELARVREAMQQLADAQSLVERALGEEPRDQLKTLRLAQGKFASYPKIQDYIAEAEGEVAQLLVNELRAAMRQAESAREARQYTEAYEKLKTARTRVAGLVKPKGELQAVLHDADILDASIAEAEKNERLINQLRDEIHQALQNGNPSYARVQFDQMPPELRTHRTAQVLATELAEFKGADEVLADAQRSLDQGDCDQTLALVDKLSDTKKDTLTEFQKQRTQELRQRARADRYFASGQRAYGSGDYETAESQLTSLIQIDPTREPRCKEMLENIQRYRKNNETVRRLLQEAKDYRRQGRWDPAYEKLEQACNIESTHKKEAKEKFDQVCRDWRDLLIRELLHEKEEEKAHRPVDMERAFDAANELLARHLDWEGDDRELGRWAKESALRERITALEQDSNWDKALQEWQGLLALRPRDVEIQKNLRHARKEALKRQAETLLVQKQTKEAIAFLLAKLNERELGMDREPDFLLKLSEAYRAAGDFDEARNWAKQAGKFDSEQGDAENHRIQAEQNILDTLKQADDLYAKQNYEGAIQLLLKAEETYPTEERLSLKRPLLTRKATELLLEQADKGQTTMSGDKAAEIIQTYVRARNLEVMGLKGKTNGPACTRAEDGINRLRNQLPGLIRSALKAASGFGIANRTISDAVDEAGKLEARLGAFHEVCGYLDSAEEDFESKVGREYKRIHLQATQLKELLDRLDLVRHADKWDKAVRDKNLSAVKSILGEGKRIDPEYGRLREVNDLDKKIAEVEKNWEEIETSLKGISNAFRGPTAEEEGQARPQRDPLALIPIHLNKYKELVRYANQLTKLVKNNPLQLYHAESFYDDLIAHQPVTYDIEREEDIEGAANHKRIAEDRAADLEKWSDWLKTARERMPPVAQVQVAAKAMRETGIEPPNADLRRLLIGKEASRLPKAQALFDECARLCKSAIQELETGEPGAPQSPLAENLKSEGARLRNLFVNTNKEAEQQCEDIRRDIEFVQKKLAEVGDLIKRGKRHDAMKGLEDLERCDPDNATVKVLRRAWDAKYGQH